MAESNATAGTTVRQMVGHDAELVELRAARVRELVFRAEGICATVALAMEATSPIDGKLDGNDAQACHQALRAAVDFLEDVTGALQPDAMTQPASKEEMALSQEVAHG